MERKQKEDKADKLSQEDRIKIYVDLWLHQNTLHWGVLRILGILEAGFLTSSYVVRERPPLRWIAFCLLFALSFIDLRLFYGHNTVRFAHQKRLEAAGILPAYPPSGSSLIHIFSFRKRISGIAIIWLTMAVLLPLNISVAAGILDLLKTEQPTNSLPNQPMENRMGMGQIEFRASNKTLC